MPSSATSDAGAVAASAAHAAVPTPQHQTMPTARDRLIFLKPNNLGHPSPERIRRLGSPVRPLPPVGAAGPAVDTRTAASSAAGSGPLGASRLQTQYSTAVSSTGFSEIDKHLDELLELFIGALEGDAGWGDLKQLLDTTAPQRSNVLVHRPDTLVSHYCERAVIHLLGNAAAAEAAGANAGGSDGDHAGAHAHDHDHDHDHWNESAMLATLERVFPDVVARTRAGDLRVSTDIITRQHKSPPPPSLLSPSKEAAAAAPLEEGTAEFAAAEDTARIAARPAPRPPQPGTFHYRQRVEQARVAEALDRHRVLEAAAKARSARLIASKPVYKRKKPLVGSPDYPLEGHPIPSDLILEEGHQWPTSMPEVLQFVGARRLQESDLDFVYLNPVDVFPMHDPYDAWTVVTEAELNPEHLVVSLTGVAHIKPGEPTVFTPITEWAAERDLFHKTRKIPFFRNFIARKALRGWVKQNRHEKFIRARETIAATAFATNPTFQRSLIKARTEMLKLHSLTFAPLDPKTTYSITMLSIMHERGLSKAEVEIKTICEQVEKGNYELEDALMKKLGDLDMTAYEHPPKAPISSHTIGKNTFEDAIMQVELNISKMPSFRKLIFTMLTQDLIGFCSSAPASDYGPAADTSRITGRGLFWIHVARHRLEGDNDVDVHRAPHRAPSFSAGTEAKDAGGGADVDADEYQEESEDIFNDTSASPEIDNGGSLEIQVIARPTGSELLEFIREGVAGLARLVVTLVRGYRKRHIALQQNGEDDDTVDAAGDHLMAQIQERPVLAKALAAVAVNVRQECAVLQPLLDDKAWIATVDMFVTEWSEDMLLRWHGSLGMIFSKLEEIDEWRIHLRDVQLLQPSPSRIFVMDNRHIGITLMPKLEAISTDLDYLLVERIEEGGQKTMEDALAKITALYHAISMSHANVKEFSNFVAGVQKAHKQVPPLRDALQKLEEMFGEHVRIRGRFGMPLREELGGLLADLDARITEFKRMGLQAIALQNALGPRMCHNLNLRLDELRFNVRGIEAELQRRPFTQPAYKPIYILEQLRLTGQRLRKITTEARDIEESLIVIGGKDKAPNMIAFDNGVKTLELRRKIWELVEVVKRTTLRFLKSPMKDANVPEMLNRLELWRQETTTLSYQQAERGKVIVAAQNRNGDEFERGDVSEHAERRPSVGIKKSGGIMMTAIASRKFSGVLRHTHEEDPVLVYLARVLDGILNIGPLLFDLSHPAMRPRHFKTLFSALGRPYDAGGMFSIRFLIACDVGSFHLLIVRLNKHARLEEVQAKELQEIKCIWTEERVPLGSQKVKLFAKKKGDPEQKVVGARARWNMVRDYMLRTVKEARRVRMLSQSSKFLSVTTFLERSVRGKDMCDVIGDTTAIDTLIADHVGILMRILSSECDVHKMQAADWLVDFQSLSDVLEQLKSTQQSWLALVAVFSKPALAEQVASYLEEFIDADAEFRLLMKNIFQQSLAMSLLLYHKTDPRHRDMQGRQLRVRLTKLQARYEKVLSTVKGDFMEQLRLASPRLYCLTDDELLEVASTPYIPSDRKNSKLSHCFTGVTQLLVSRFKTGELESPTDYTRQVDGFRGERGIELLFLAPVVVDRSAPPLAWHSQLESAMHRTLVELLNQCILQIGDKPLTATTSNEYIRLLASWPRQTLVVAHELWFASEVDAVLQNNVDSELAGAHRALQKAALLRVHDARTRLLGIITNMLKYRNTPNEARAAASDVYLILSAQQERLQQLRSASKNVLSPMSFAWQRHSRYSFAKTEDEDAMVSNQQRCIVSVPGATFQYTHEFDGRLGSGLQLGPITDRYLLNIHLAMHGASVPLLSGPVGVGKTSLVRQAASVLGRFLIEMQCSPSVTAKPLSRALTGAMKLGAWLVLKAVHTLLPGQQSLLSATALKAHWAAAAGDGGIAWLGNRKWVKRNLNSGLLATTQLESSTYKLSAFSDGLRSVMRPLNIVPPNAVAVIEAALVVRGFSTARELAVKLATFQEMAFQHLQHCSVHLGFAMLLVIMNQAKHVGKTGFKGQFATEVSQVIEAIRSLVEPGLINDDGSTNDDRRRYREIMYDIFGDSIVKRTKYTRVQFMLHNDPHEEATLRQYVAMAMSDLGFMMSPPTTESVMALVRATELNQSIVMVGLPGTGKTTTIMIAASVLQSQGRNKASQLLVRAMSGRSPKKQKRRLRKKGGGIARTESGALAFDATPTALATMEEIKAVLAEIDLNNDGIVSKEEIDAFALLAASGSSASSTTPSNVGSRQLLWRDGLAPDAAAATAQDASSGPTLSLTHVYPGSSNMAGLLGEYDPVTGAWLDGTLTAVVRSAQAPAPARTGSPIPPHERKDWILCDGTLKSELVDLLGTALAHRQLRLPSGESLKIQQSTSMLFETNELAGASPALLQNVALVNMPRYTLRPKDHLAAWNMAMAAEHPFLSAYHHIFIQKALERLVVPSVKQARAYGARIASGEAARHFLKILQACIASEIKAFTPEEKAYLSGRSYANIKNFRQFLGCLITFSYVWLYSGLVAEEYKLEMDVHFRERIAAIMPEVDLPTKGRLTEYVVSAKQNKLVHASYAFKTMLAEPIDAQGSSFKSSANWTGTVESLPVATLMRSLLMAGAPVFVHGAPGNGKTALIRHVWETNFRKIGAIREFPMSANVTGRNFRSVLSSHVSSRDPTHWDARATQSQAHHATNQRVLLFVDDISDANRRTLHRQNDPLEVLRELLDKGCIWDESNRCRDMRHVSCVVAGTAAPNLKGSWSTIRVMRHFVPVHHGYINEASVTSIFGGGMTSWVAPLNNSGYLTPRAKETLSLAVLNVVRTSSAVDVMVRKHLAEVDNQNEDSIDEILPKAFYNLSHIAQVCKAMQVYVPVDIETIAAAAKERAKGHDGNAATEEDLKDEDDSIDMDFFNMDDDEEEEEAEKSTVTADPKVEAPFLVPYIWYEEAMHAYGSSFSGSDASRAWLHTTLARCAEEKGLLTVESDAFVQKVAPAMPLKCAYLPDPDTSGVGLALSEQQWIPADDADALVALQQCAEKFSRDKGKSGGTLPIITADGARDIGMLCRKIAQNQHALLVGKRGTGRVLFGKLAAHICGTKHTFVVQPPSSGRLSDFRKRLLPICSSCMTYSKSSHVLVIGNDYELTSEMIAEVGALLKNGWLPGMEEGSALTGVDAKFVIGRGDPTVFGQLSVVVCIDSYSYASASLGTSMQDFLGGGWKLPLPNDFALASRTTLQRFVWTEASIEDLARGYINAHIVNNRWNKRDLAGFDALPVWTTDTVAKLAKALKDIYLNAVNNASTAEHTDGASLFSMLRTFVALLAHRSRILGSGIRVSQTLIMRVSKANDIIAEFQGQIDSILPTCNAATLKCDKLYKNAVAKRDALAGVVKRRIELEKSKTKQEEVISSLKALFQREFAAILEVLDAAVASLLALKQEDIEEMSGYNAPPARVILTTMPLVLLFRPYRNHPNYAADDPRLPKLKEDPTWIEAKLLLTQFHFFDKIVEFDRDSISVDTLRRVQKIIYAGNYEPADLAQGSKACFSLSQWVLAVAKYAEICLRLEPFRQQLLAAETELEEIIKRLAKSQVKEQQLRQDVRSAKSDLAAAQEYRKEVHAQLQTIRLRQARARKVFEDTTGLVDRVKAELGDMLLAVQTITGDIAVASGCITYTSALPASTGDLLVAEWVARCQHQQVPVRSDLSLAQCLSKKDDVNYWISQGLPAQNKTLLNSAIMMKSSIRWPLIWDPYALAARLLNRIDGHAGRELVAIPSGDENLVEKIRIVMKQGNSVLITGVEASVRLSHKHPALSSLFAGETPRKSPAGNPLYTVGGADIEADKNFRLYMTRSSRFVPEDFHRKCCLIAFSDPKLVLEELLSEACVIELPDAEEEREESSDKVRGFTLHLREQLNELMNRMQHVTAKQFEDSGFTDEILAIHKSHEDGRVTEAAETQKRALLDQRRRVMRGVAHHGVQLFKFAITVERANQGLNRYSLGAFVKVFVKCLTNIREMRQRTRSQADELETLNTLNAQVQRWLCAGVSNFQAREFAVALALSRMLVHHRADQSIVDTFLHQASGVGLLSGVDGDYSAANASNGNRSSIVARPGWLNSASWSRVQFIAQRVPALQWLPKQLADEDEEELWEEYLADGPSLRDPCPYRPGGGAGGPGVVLPLHKVLIIQALKPAALLEACRELVTQTEGMGFYERPHDLLAEITSEPRPGVPVIVELTNDGDPMFDLMQFVSAAKAEQKCTGQIAKEVKKAPKMSYHKHLAGDDAPTPVSSKAWYKQVADKVVGSGAELGWRIRKVRMTGSSDAAANKDQPLVVIGLGSSNLPDIEEIMVEAACTGQWVLFHNCHLGSSTTLRTIARTFKQIRAGMSDESVVSPAFKLWMTSRQTDALPWELLLPAQKLHWQQPVRRGHRRAQWYNRMMRGPLYGPTHAASCEEIAKILRPTLAATAAVHIPDALKSNTRFLPSVGLFKVTKMNLESAKVKQVLDRKQLLHRLAVREAADTTRARQIAQGLSALSSSEAFRPWSEGLLDVISQVLFHPDATKEMHVPRVEEVLESISEVLLPRTAVHWEVDTVLDVLRRQLTEIDVVDYDASKGAGGGGGEPAAAAGRNAVDSTLAETDASPFVEASASDFPEPLGSIAAKMVQSMPDTDSIANDVIYPELDSILNSLSETVLSAVEDLQNRGVIDDDYKAVNRNELHHKASTWERAVANKVLDGLSGVASRLLNARHDIGALKGWIAGGRAYVLPRRNKKVAFMLCSGLTPWAWHRSPEMLSIDGWCSLLNRLEDLEDIESDDESDCSSDDHGGHGETANISHRNSILHIHRTASAESSSAPTPPESSSAAPPRWTLAQSRQGKRAGSTTASRSATADAIFLVGDGAGSVHDLKRWVAHQHGVDLSEVSVKFSLEEEPLPGFGDDGEDDADDFITVVGDAGGNADDSGSDDDILPLPTFGATPPASTGTTPPTSAADRSAAPRGQYCLTIQGIQTAGTKWTGSEFSGHEGVLGHSVLSAGPNILIDFTVGVAVHRSSTWEGDVVGSTVSAHEYVCPIVGTGGDVAQRTITFGSVLVRAADGGAEALAASGARLVIALP